VSPTSRGRRPKKKSEKKSGPSRGRRPSEDAGLARVLREIGQELAEARDALDAELAVSSIAGSWWDLDMGDADPEVEIGERLVAHAAGRRRNPAALALLRVMAELGTPAQRRAAAEGAAAHAAGGVPEPAWVGGLDTARHTGSWAYGDVYGDQTSVLLAFDRPRPHGIAVLVDHTLGGYAKDAFVVDDPAATLREIQDLADDTIWVRELPPAEAAAMLVPAFAATDAGRDQTLGDDFRDTRAVAVARLRLLPEPPPAPATPAEDPAAVADEFLASAARPTDLDDAAVATCARLIARLMSDLDGQPGRVSPAKVEILLIEQLPIFLDDDAPEQDALPDVLRAWVGWAAQRAGLAEAAREALEEATDELIETAASEVPEEFVDALLDGVPEDVTPEDVAEILARRTFAVGTPSAIVDGEEMLIDPSDADERALAIRSEHPEYAEALDDPFGDGMMDGVNVRLHIAMHEMVANQLWTGEPAETWEAAQRLLDSGMDRHDVLHALAEVAAHQVHAALAEQRPYDAVTYAAELAALGADRRTPWR
jgi:hypothetical protein